MITENEEFFELLRYSKKLKENNKFLFHEDYEKYRKLLKLSARIENNLQLQEKNNYSELIEIFLNNQISAEDFSFYFIAKYDEIVEISRLIQENFEQNYNKLSNLLLKNKDKECSIGRYLLSMYDYCDEFDPNSNSLGIDEENLRNYAKMLLIELNIDILETLKTELEVDSTLVLSMEIETLKFTMVFFTVITIVTYCFLKPELFNFFLQ